MRLRLDFFVQKGLLIQHNGRRSYYFPSTLNPTFLQMAPEFLVFHYHSKSQPDFHISHCSQWSCFSYIYIFFPSHLLSSPSFSLSLLVATQSWGHIAGLPTAESRLPVKKRNFWGLGFCVFRRKSPRVWSAGMILYMWAPRTPNFAAKQTDQQFIVVSAGAHTARVKCFRFYLKKTM